MGKSTTIFLQILENQDGSLTRPVVPLSPPTGEVHDSPVHSKDVPLNPTHNTWLRIYRPNLPSPPEGKKKKLPVILYSHGGGFVIFNADSIFYHQFCEQMATALPAVVVSLEYRLAPESRLPAAYDDAVEAVLWAQAQARDPSAGDPWLAGSADFSRFFLMGSSSGANIAYQATLRAAAAAADLAPLGLAGLVLHQPYFGGVERTPSEVASEEDVILPLRASDMMWRLALPEGADRDHNFCNPVASAPPSLRLPRCLVSFSEGDPLVDRQRAFARMLESAGVSVVRRLDEKGYHAVELFDPAMAQALFTDVRDFVNGSSVDGTAA